MDDQQSIEMIDSYIYDSRIRVDDKFQKLKELVLLFCDKWTDERTLCQRYKDKCDELLDITQMS